MSLLVLFSPFFLFSQTVSKIQITGVEEMTFLGEYAEELKSEGKSGKGYRVKYDNDFTVVQAEELDILLKFKGLSGVKQLIGTNLSAPVKNVDNILSYEILNAKKRGQYKPPTSDEFIKQLGNEFVNSENHCPKPENFIDKDTSAKYGSDLYRSEEFPKKLEAEMKKLAGDATVTSTKCTEKIASRGPTQCYDIKLNKRAVTKFMIGPYQYAGISCDDKDRVKLPPKSGEEGQRAGARP